MSNRKNEQPQKPETKKPAAAGNDEAYSLNDDRRVKVLSPGALVAKRFFRNRLAVTGLTTLIIMFLFSFLGGLLSPYKEDECFYRYEMQSKPYAAMTENTEFRDAALDSSLFSTVIKAQLQISVTGKKDAFTYNNVNYAVQKESAGAEDDFYSASVDGKVVGIIYKDNVSITGQKEKPAAEFIYGALKAYFGEDKSFTADGVTYTVDADGEIYKNGAEYGYISRNIFSASATDVVLTREFEAAALEAMKNGTESSFTHTIKVAGEEQEAEFKVIYDPAHTEWSINKDESTYVYDKYTFPTWEHWCGTDGNGMDMLTRLMYGGRVSLLIGFIVVFLETFIGVVLGGIAGYFGGWVDNLIMRIVDIFYCIPSMPILIILGAMMDKERVDSTLRMIYLMLLLGVLGWAGIARLVRGQILSLREQEFMTATEACGIRASRRIFRHLIPNVIPQLIVTCTMGLGSTIITEATLSFLGLGVRFPFASWGNIISDVNDIHVLTTYWFVWIPAGVCLLLTVLAFNLLGDGLRDAFDPKMKR